MHSHLIALIASHGVVAHHAQSSAGIKGFLFIVAIVVVLLSLLHTAVSKAFGRRSS